MSHHLKLERMAPAWARAWKSHSASRMTRMTIVQGGLPTAGVQGEFAVGMASMLDGPGRAVTAKVADCS